MSETNLAVARGLLLHGKPEALSRLKREWLLEETGVPDGTFRSAGELLGATGSPGLRFFDCSVRGQIAFGPGAGLAIGISVGTESLRTALVDINGWIRVAHEATPDHTQLLGKPEVLLSRIRTAVEQLIQLGRLDPSLLVDGKIPLLGCAVAWPSPLSREKYPQGYALAHADWHTGLPLDDRVERELRLGPLDSYAINDCHAAAIAVAHRLTHSPEGLARRHPHLTIVLRIAGGVGGAVVVVEPAKNLPERQRESGFLSSVLIGGHDNFAGEIGHAPINPTTIEQLNRKTPRRLAKLKAVRCSCHSPDDSPPDHVEAYASGRAVAARFDRKRPMHTVLREILDDPESPNHNRALRDVGSIVGDALVGPASILNPASVVITGILAVPAVRALVEERLLAGHLFGREPVVALLDADENSYIRSKGAALALIRNAVHRRLPMILDRYQFIENIRNLTTPI
jgi:predicted NBD/HSP70 family sugar kinase